METGAAKLLVSTGTYRMKLLTAVKLIALPVAGVALMLVPFFLMVRAVTKPTVLETVAPGEAVFIVDKGGKYTVWRTVAGTYDDEFRIADRELPPGLTLSIRNATDGTTVAIESSIGHTETANDQSHYSLIKADLSPGKYELVSSTAGETIGLRVKETVGSIRGFFIGLITGIAGFLLFFGGLIYAAAVLIKEAVKNPQNLPPQ